jgi:hypothetical protein
MLIQAIDQSPGNDTTNGTCPGSTTGYRKVYSMSHAVVDFADPIDGSGKSCLSRLELQR